MSASLTHNGHARTSHDAGPKVTRPPLPPPTQPHAPPPPQPTVPAASQGGTPPGVTAKAPHKPVLQWKTLVLARANELEHELKALGQPVSPDHRGFVQECITEARARAVPARWGRLWRETVCWFTGADQEAAWIALHAGDVCLTRYRSGGALTEEVPILTDRVRREFPKRGDTTGEALLEELKSISLPGADAAKLEDARATIASIRAQLYDRSHAAYQSKRAFRNVVILMTLVLAAAATAIAIPHTSISRWMLLDLVGRPPANSMWTIEFVGALGGLVTAVVALQALETLKGPYALPVAQAALKLPMGAITGVLGAILLQSGLFGVDPVTKAVEFYAIVLVFGASQQLVTHFIDAKAEELTKTADPKEATP